MRGGLVRPHLDPWCVMAGLIVPSGQPRRPSSPASPRSIRPSWAFAAGMFVLSLLLFSRAAAVVTLVPVGLALRPPSFVPLGAYTAANGYFFLPTYGTVLAAVSFVSDRHDAHRQVPAQPQLHAARSGGDTLGDRCYDNLVAVALRVMAIHPTWPVSRVRDSLAKSRHTGEDFVSGFVPDKRFGGRVADRQLLPPSS